jgi:hypothetical protein
MFGLFGKEEKQEKKCGECSKTLEIDRKLRDLEIAEENARTIERKRLYSSQMGYSSACVIKAKNHYAESSDVRELKLSKYMMYGDVKEIVFSEGEVKELRDFLNKHFPINKVVE